MPLHERRRLAEEAKAIIRETRLATEALRICVARSRVLVSESQLLLSQRWAPYRETNCRRNSPHTKIVRSSGRFEIENSGCEYSETEKKKGNQALAT